MRVKETLDLIAFLFTILMVLYGLTKGFDAIELFINLIYFTVLILSQLENLKDALGEYQKIIKRDMSLEIIGKSIEKTIEDVYNK